MSLGTLLLTAVVPGAAQTPAERAAVFGFRDSLAAVIDSGSLLRLEAGGIDTARQRRDDASLHLRLGFVGLRLALVTGHASHFRDAEGEFQWATELQPRWPLAWYGLGSAELAEADGGFGFMRGLLGTIGHDVYVQPAHDLAHSAEVDSSFVRGLLELSDDALRHGIGAHLDAALLALREVAPDPVARNPAVLLARGRIERDAGDMDSALIAFQSLVTRRPDDPVALLELARTRFETGWISGVAPWYRGLALADSAALAMYHFDLSLVMSDSALQAFDTASAAERVAVARHFWDTRDPESLNSSAERLREHYRRIEVARRTYAMPRSDRYDSLPTFAPTGAQFDDRGRVYVRHGEPDARTSLSLAALPPNETWVYHRPSGDLIFNFAEPDSARGFRLYESLLDIAGLGGAAQHTGQGNVRARLDSGAPLQTYGAAWTAETVHELLESRASLSPEYRQLLDANPHNVTALERTERVEGRRELVEGLQTDDWHFGYELALKADVDVLAVGTTARGSEVQVAFAVSGASLYASPTTGQVVYPVRTRVSVRTIAGDLVASVDSQRYFAAAHELAPDADLLGRLALPVPPGDYVVRVALETPSRGIVIPPLTVHVSAMTAPAHVTLSDLALGARSVPLPWAVGGDTAWINPSHRFKSSEPMQLFFEVGGAAAGTAMRVELSILRPGHRASEMQFAYSSISRGSPDRLQRAIDIGRLGPGHYLVQVAVSIPGGARTVRQRPFTVIR